MRKLAVLGFAALVVLFVICISVMRRGFSTRTEPGGVEFYVAAHIRDWSIPEKYKAMRNTVSCSAGDLSEARTHWADHCATCHANNGSGDSLFGRGLYPRPPDMRQARTQSQSDGELYYTIKSGVRFTGMPAFGDPGDADADSWKLVCFIRHLPQVSDEEEREMQKMNPKTPEDLEEERQEEQFLNGGPAPPQSEHHHHH
jgi:cbb3-type cytochrome c oxidase subunit III